MVITVSLTTAADQKMAPATQLQKAGTVMPPITAMVCPQGWHKFKSTSEEFKCAPNKPSQMKCPEGWKYVEALDCKSYAGYGTQTTCSGCEVGCIKIPIIK
jgi:hypothetical protein